MPLQVAAYTAPRGTREPPPPVAKENLTLGNIKRTMFLIRSREDTMIRALVQEAAALTSITLFLATIALWTQVFAIL
jgi:hypothetical protein